MRKLFRRLIEARRYRVAENLAQIGRDHPRNSRTNHPVAGYHALTRNCGLLRIGVRLEFRLVVPRRIRAFPAEPPTL